MKKNDEPYRYYADESSSLEDKLKQVMEGEYELHDRLNELYSSLVEIDREAIAAARNASGEGQEESFIIAVEMLLQLVKNAKGELSKVEIVMDDIGISG